MKISNLKNEGLVVGIDASRNRSGGAKVHLVGILTEGNPLQHGIREVHLWSYQSLLDSIPDQTWLIKHNPKELDKSLLRQLWWQRFDFPNEVRQAGCSIVFNTDAGTISSIRPCITMSQDMLSYEPGAIERYGFSKDRLRLILLRYIQNRSLRQADGDIFLTRYAAKVIQQYTGKLTNIAFIPHGITDKFKQTKPIKNWPEYGERSICSIYVSPAWRFKHQWVVVKAIAGLRRRGHNITLKLVGGGSGRAQQLLDEQLAISDPKGNFVEQMDFVSYDKLPALLANADMFIFASSCENMPNSLVEAMSVGLPIACSNCGPMPEVLSDGGVYFNPEDAESISEAVKRIITEPELRSTIAKRAKYLSEQYSWSRCANETWSFIADTYSKISI